MEKLPPQIQVFPVYIVTLSHAEKSPPLMVTLCTVLSEMEPRMLKLPPKVPAVMDAVSQDRSVVPSMVPPLMVTAPSFHAFIPATWPPVMVKLPLPMSNA